MDKEVIIRVEGLGKRYVLGKNRESGQYTALRDVLANQIKAPFRRLRSGDRESKISSQNIFWALKDVNFEVGRGEVVGIIGRNGAGKSTLLKVLSRITEPTKGRITLKGRVASLLEVGTGFHPELTGRENIYLNGAILGMHRSEIKGKFDEIVAFAEVERFLDTPVKRYSSGMYVRLAFAVAAHLDPEILIVDEVLAVGDVEFQKKCLGKMQDVARGEGRTVLFVSHVMSNITSLCSQCIYLKEGSVVVQGQVSEVVTRYIEEGFTSNSLHADLTDKPRVEGAARLLRLDSVAINTGEEIIRFRDTLSLSFEVTAFGDVERLFLGIGVTGMNGQRLFTVEGDQSALPMIRRGQRATITMKVADPSLPPGRYTLAIGANSGTGLALDYVAEALSFAVVPNPDEMLYAERIGLGLRPRAEWEYSTV